MGSIKFCDSCGSILKSIFENDKSFGICNCGFKKELESLSLYSESNSKILSSEEKGSGVFIEVAPLAFKHKCRKCDHEESDVLDFGVQIGDESNIIVYTCRKCGFAERQADGSGNK